MVPPDEPNEIVTGVDRFARANSSLATTGGPDGRRADAIARLTTPPRLPHRWYKDGMARVRISTTVDEQLLAAARETRSGVNDSVLIDEALAALLARSRAVAIDAAYAAYDRVPVDAGDEWGDLASFRAAAGSS
jgi:hypothetical protein